MNKAVSFDRPRLIFLVTEDWYFFSHRQPMVRAAQLAGFDVAVITAVDKHREQIEALGVKVIPLSLERRSLNPLRAFVQIFKLIGIYRAEKPAIVHHIAMKPVLYGSVAAWFARVPGVVNAFAGLGYVFSSDARLAKLLRPLLVLMFCLFLRRPNSWTLFQNADDRALMEKYGIAVPARTRLIRGSGVDISAYASAPVPEAAPDFICVFAGRMIGIKGLATLKEAFEIIAAKNNRIKLWLCGTPDPANPGSWTENELMEWQARSGNVVYKRHVADMAAVWRQAHLALQPSWGGEGVPKSLLEAASCGRAIVASDVPGCREVVDNGRNGYLVPPKDAAALAARILEIASDSGKCRVMGAESRKIVEGDMSAEAVTAQTRELYDLVSTSR